MDTERTGDRTEQPNSRATDFADFTGGIFEFDQQPTTNDQQHMNLEIRKSGKGKERGWKHCGNEGLLDCGIGEQPFSPQRATEVHRGRSLRFWGCG